MKILLAGATGVLGRALVPRLLAGGHTVRGLPSPAPADAPPAGVEPVEADLVEDDLVRVVGGCDAVIVATAIPTGPATLGATTVPPDTAATRRLLDAALACRIPRYLHVSTVAAYRDGGDDWLDELSPLDDSSARAATCGPLIELEAAIREVEPRSLGWTILRGGSLVGSEADERLLEQLRSGELAVAGTGANYLSPIAVNDLASALVAALELAPPGSTFNVVDEPLRYCDYVDALADLIGVARPRRAAELPLPPSWRCTNKAARDALDWVPRERIWPDACARRGCSDS